MHASILAVLCSSHVVGCAVAPSDDDAKGAHGVEPIAYRDYAQLTDVNVAVSPSDLELEHEIELRRSYGLSADPDYVRSLFERSSGRTAVRSKADLLGGILIADDEIEHAIERAEVEYHGPVADLWAQATLGERYAGSYLDGTHVVVQCAGCDTAAARGRFDDVDANLPEVLRGRVIVRSVSHSLGELAAREERLAKFLARHGIAGNGSTVDALANDVVLHVGPADAAKLDALRANLDAIAGGSVRIIREASNSVDDINKDQALGYWVVEGGQAIGKDVSSRGCTSGFAVQGYYGPFMLTAGHCAGLSDYWYQGGFKLGPTKASINSGSMDAALISTYGVRNNVGRIHVNAADDFHPVTFPVTTHNLLNQTVCQTGYMTTGMDGYAKSTRCGMVTTLVHRPSSNHNATFGVARYQRTGGDSGAGVYWPTGYGFGAAGLHKGGTSSNPIPGVFTRYPVIANHWGLTLSPY